MAGGSDSGGFNLNQHADGTEDSSSFMDQFTVTNSDSYLTSDVGGPIQDDQSSKAGERGPKTLEDFVFRQKSNILIKSDSQDELSMLEEPVYHICHLCSNNGYGPFFEAQVVKIDRPLISTTPRHSFTRNHRRTLEQYVTPKQPLI
ncbi:putative Catalase [Drepanopeziza brunnea f. sp. 'multigermtubi' MB_m1]|uniref:Putative Catalase n=1 Tax=Marssonina brunnea f. sp. multigermtubi (strain MB_m1) TaxID=1072389 RepID=K1WXW9_MARBU|nr:putative Catalase [Drepanopeziza brunnea f. sp. 'multigermtubi' MB_m1]EKD17417.1 putative Catalase [Drepanopeziza brunnea f. sp. 'multigermtubi' MB_m1]